MVAHMVHRHLDIDSLAEDILMALRLLEVDNQDLVQYLVQYLVSSFRYHLEDSQTVPGLHNLDYIHRLVAPDTVQTAAAAAAEQHIEEDSD
jgi:hypothetical protein